jgi:hypothetical protein
VRCVTSSSSLYVAVVESVVAAFCELVVTTAAPDVRVS